VWAMSMYPATYVHIVPIPIGHIIVAHPWFPQITISSAITFVHEDPSIFEDPHRFLPERWAGKDGKALSPHFVPFSEGSRRCIGSK